MLTDEKRAEILEIFQHYDTDKNGVVDRDEFARLCRALDADFSDEELAAGLDAVDHNGNGQIEFDEFLDWWRLRYE